MKNLLLYYYRSKYTVLTDYGGGSARKVVCFDIYIYLCEELGTILLVSIAIIICTDKSNVISVGIDKSMSLSIGTDKSIAILTNRIVPTSSMYQRYDTIYCNCNILK